MGEVERRKIQGIIPQHAQRQDSLHDQLLDLRAAAIRLGMYDADDFLRAFTTLQRDDKRGCADGMCGVGRAVGAVTWGGTVDNPTAMNLSLKRYVDGTDGRWTCWMFDRPGQEEYRLVGETESRGTATMWVEGRRAHP